MPTNVPPIAKPKNPFVDEIEAALKESSGEKRIKVLMSVTDLFVGNSTKFTENETKMFDDMMGHLIKHVESRALVELSRRLAPIPNAPRDTIQSLARNDAIVVSGPVLMNSNQLSDADLVEIAKTKSQAHLASIASRPRINEVVTEVLVDRGNDEVANRVANNSGARLSTLTIEKLVMRAEADEKLAGSLSRRTDIPPAIFRNLMIQATDAVRSKLMASVGPGQKEMVKQVLDELSAQVSKRPSAPRNYGAAQQAVAAFSQDTDLTKKKILDFANMRRVAEMIIALSVLSGVAVEQIDTLFLAPTYFGLMVLCKSIMLDWNSVCAVFMARPHAPGSKAAPFEDFREQYEEFSVSSAQQLLRFWVGRQKMARNFS